MATKVFVLYPEPSAVDGKLKVAAEKKGAYLEGKKHPDITYLVLFIILFSFETAANKTKAETKKENVKTLLKGKGKPAVTPSAITHITIYQNCYFH